MTTLQTVLLIYLTLINLTGLFLFGLDKRKAARHQWRIPERTLLMTAFLGGSLGSLAGMILFHHKTRKAKFFILVPVFLFAHIWLFAQLFLHAGIALY